MTVLDLTGPSGGWTAASRTRWHHCLESAGRSPGAWDTTPRTGLPRLRDALAAAVGLDPERLAVTSGIRSQVAELTYDARTLVVEAPGFQSIAGVARQQGVAVEPCDWEAMLSGEHVSADRVLWLTSPCRNPDGRTLSGEQAERLGELVGASRRVVVNQAYFWCAPRSARPVGAHLVGSLHKLAGGGSALGWRWGPEGPGPERPARGGPPTMWQLAWAQFVEEGGLEDLAEQALHAPSRRCARFVDLLPVRDDLRPDHGGGPSLVLSCDGARNGQELVAAFAERGLRVGAGAAFGCPPETVRLSFTGVTDDDVETCARRVTTVADALAGTRRADRR